MMNKVFIGLIVAMVVLIFPLHCMGGGYTGFMLELKEEHSSFNSLNQSLKETTSFLNLRTGKEKN